MKVGAKCVYEDRSWIFVEQQFAPPVRPSRLPPRANLSPPSLLLADWRQQLETMYLEAYLPSGESRSDTAFTQSVVGTWIPTIRYLASQDSVARLAFDSCILMALGQMQGNLDFTENGMTMYCQALTKTNRALQHAVLVEMDATLATCALLAMCERFRPHAQSEVSTQATDFHRHVQGTAQLLELRGSHRHVHEHGFTLFANARSIIAHSSLTQRRRAYLDTHRTACLDSGQWFEVPWGMQTRQRTLKDKLVDAMLAVAASLELLDQLINETRRGCQPPSGALNACVGKCAASARQLLAWKTEVLRASAQARLEDVCAGHGFGMFHLVMSYWAVFLLLSARCWPILTCISEPTPASQALASLLPSSQACAINIATHSHRYFPPTTGLVGPQYATFPLSVALLFDAARSEQPMTGGPPLARNNEDEMSTAMERMRDLFRLNERARSTAEFLRSMAQSSEA